VADFEVLGKESNFGIGGFEGFPEDGHFCSRAFIVESYGGEQLLGPIWKERVLNDLALFIANRRDEYELVDGIDLVEFEFAVELRAIWQFLL